MNRSFDPARTRLRTTIATLQREIAHLPKGGEEGRSGDALKACVEDLVLQLALGPEPEVRECPVCQAIGMRAATRCGSCWTTLTPPTKTIEPTNIAAGEDE